MPHAEMLRKRRFPGVRIRPCVIVVVTDTDRGRSRRTKTTTGPRRLLPYSNGTARVSATKFSTSRRKNRRLLLALFAVGRAVISEQLASSARNKRDGGESSILSNAPPRALFSESHAHMSLRASPSHNYARRARARGIVRFPA